MSNHGSNEDRKNLDRYEPIVKMKLRPTGGARILRAAPTQIRPFPEAGGSPVRPTTRNDTVGLPLALLS